MKTKFCVNCRYFQKGKAFVRNQTTQDKLFSDWCLKLKIGTAWNLLRCGGDVFESKLYKLSSARKEINDDTEEFERLEKDPPHKR